MNLNEIVASPCIQICKLDQAQICEGCGRSLAEIAEWTQATAARQREIVECSRRRMKSLTPTNPGPDHE